MFDNRPDANKERVINKHIEHCSDWIENALVETIFDNTDESKGWVRLCVEFNLIDDIV